MIIIISTGKITLLDLLKPIVLPTKVPRISIILINTNGIIHKLINELIFFNLSMWLLYSSNYYLTGLSPVF